MTVKEKKKDWQAEKIAAAKGTTYITIVLDQSTSMGSSKEQAVAGYNDTVEELWKLAKEGNDIKVSLITFDTHVYEHLWNVPAEDLKKSNYDSFKPQKMTALWDGMGYAIDKLMELDLGENDAVLVITMSDGGENASKHVKPAQLHSKIKEAQGGQWTFTYMGCSMANLRQISEATAIPISNCASWSSENYESTGRAMAQNKGKLGGYMNKRSRGVKAKGLVSNFHSEDETVAADYTSDDGHGVDKGVELTGDNNFAKLYSLDSHADISKSSTEVNMTVEGGVNVFSNANQVDLSSYEMKNLS